MAATGLTATAASATRINLSWTADGDGILQAVFRGTTSGGETLYAGGLSASATSYSDTGCSEGTKYYYKIRTTYTPGVYEYSSEANATSWLATPTSLAGHAETNTSIHLTWSDNSTHESGYEVYKNGTKVTTTAASAETYTNTGLTTGTTYSYKIKAVGTPPDSAYSTTINVLCLLTPTAPSGLALTVLGTTSIKLDWTDNSSNEDKFKIYRSTDGGSTYAYLNQVNANVETYTDTGLTASTEYYYKVRAYNDAGYSSYCTAVSATTASAVTLAAPTSLVVAALTGTKVEISFTNNSVGEEYHSIERDAVEIKQLGTGSTTYTDSGLTPGTAYAYKVRDYEGGDYSDYCTSSAATTPKEFAWIAWGDNSAAASSSATTLGSEVSRAEATVELATTYSPNDTVRFYHEFTADSSATVCEVGVFDASSAGNMLGRKIASPTVAVGEGNTFRVQYDFPIKDGGCGG